MRNFIVYSILLHGIFLTGAKGQSVTANLTGIPLDSLTYSGLEAKITEEALRLHILQPEAELEATANQLGLPEDWRNYRALELTAEATAEAHFELRIYGDRCFLPGRLQISPGQPEKFLISLDDLSLTGSSYTPAYLKWVWERAENSSVTIRQIRLLPRLGNTLPPVADRFGQRVNGDWPEKIKEESELRNLARQEWEQLQRAEGPVQHNEYGGWTGGPRFEPTGFFRLEKGKEENGLTAWWLVDPAGYPFWSLGTTGLRPKYPRSDVTLYKEREYLFEELPPRQGKYAEAYEGEGYVSFYCWNILRKWGSLERWREVSFRRLQAWGMNTIGNWAEEAVLNTTPLPYTRALRTNEGTAVKLRLQDSRFPDVFDPAWAAHLDTLFAANAAWREDPLLLGYFVDNELHWGDLDLLNKAGEESHLRQEWLKQLQSSYQGLIGLNAAWDSQFASWEEVRNLKGELPDTPEFIKDYERLEKAFAETYFRNIATYLKKHDPNHLYLGCRFTRALKPPHVIAAAGKWCDVVSINVYSYAPIRKDMEQWHRLSGGSPMLIGEHHVPLKSERQLPPKYRNFSADERYNYYYNYVHTWAHMPFAVGSHWYQYKDQPLTGRASNGENQPVGLVDITDQPHEELIRAIREVSAHMYDWHMSAWEK